MHLSPILSRARGSRGTLYLGLAVLGWLVSTVVLPAQTEALWLGNLSGNWFDAANWDPAAVPTLTTNVTIDVGTGFIQPLIATADASANNVVVGNTSSSDLTTLLAISAGRTLTANDLTAGSDTGSFGAVTVAGAGSKLTLSDGLTLGSDGTGNLSITSGGNVSLANSALVGFFGNGNISVSGGNSVLNVGSSLFVGVFGQGNLSVANAGNVVVGADADVGSQSGAVGAVTVDGGNSALNVAGMMNVGNGGNGTLSITSGGNVTVGSDFSLSNSSDAVGALTVDSSGGEGSVLNVGGTLYVGQSGLGTINITAGGLVHNTGADSTGVGASLGGQSGATGNVNVAGVSAGSVQSELQVSSGALLVGDADVGILDVTSGGFVDASGVNADGVSLAIGNQTDAVGSVTVSGVDGISSFSSLLDISGGSLMVGNGGNGTLNLADGGILHSSGVDLSGVAIYVGNQTGSVGNFSVTGVNGGIPTRVTIENGATIVGNAGNGTLTILDGGNMDIGAAALDAAGLSIYVGNQDGGTGSFTISGVNGDSSLPSQLNIERFAGGVVVGNAGNGTLSLLDGGQATIQGADGSGVSLYLGNQTGTTGTVIVSGVESVSTLSSNFTFTRRGGAIVVGNAGTGIFSVLDGGFASVLGADGNDVSVYIGNQADSVGNISVSGVDTGTGRGAELDVTGSFARAVVVGNAGNGTLNIGDGGTVAVSSFIQLGAQDGSQGTVNLSTNGTLKVGGGEDGIRGGDGTGSFNLLGGMLQVTDNDFSTSLAATLGNGTISTIDTHTFNATWSGTLSGPGGLAKIGDGSLTLTAVNSYQGGTTVSGGMLVLTDVGGGNSVVGTGNLSVLANGTLAGNGRIAGNAVIAGNLSPGNSPGLIIFGANLTLTANATTNLDLAGNTTRGTDYDAFNVGGNLTANGTLTIGLLDDFVPVNGDIFHLFSVSGSIVGSFTNVNLPSLGGGWVWNTSNLYSAGDLFVTAVPEPAVWGLLFGAGLLGWTTWGRSRRKNLSA